MTNEKEKVTDITWNLDAWYVKLIAFIFGKKLHDNVINMQNSCPIFWVIIASMLLTPIIAPIKGFIWLLKPLQKMYKKLRVRYANKWIKNLSRIKFCDFLYYDDLILITYIPKEFKYLYDINILTTWAKHHNIEINDEMTKSEIYEKLLQNLTAELEERKQILSKRSKEQIETNLKKAELIKRKKQTILKVKNKLDISKIQFNDTNKIIKNAKRIIGLLITTFILTILFFFVQSCSSILTYMIDNWSNVSETLLIILYGVILTLIALAILIMLGLYTEKTTKKWKSKNNLKWYDYIGIYFVLGIYYILKSIIWYPIYYIIYIGLWQFCIVGLLWGIIKGFGIGILSSTGIFGKYFSATKSDFCPGAVWVNKKENKQ